MTGIKQYVENALKRVERRAKVRKGAVNGALGTGAIALGAANAATFGFLITPTLAAAGLTAAEIIAVTAAENFVVAGGLGTAGGIGLIKYYKKLSQNQALERFPTAALHNQDKQLQEAMDIVSKAWENSKHGKAGKTIDNIASYKLLNLVTAANEAMHEARNRCARQENKSFDYEALDKNKTLLNTVKNNISAELTGLFKESKQKSHFRNMFKKANHVNLGNLKKHHTEIYDGSRKSSFTPVKRLLTTAAMSTFPSENLAR